MNVVEDYLANPEKYLDYMISTQASWRIYACLTMVEQFRKAFKALGTSTLVVKLNIGGTNAPPGSFRSNQLSNNDVSLLVSSIEQNNSLEKLTLSNFSTQCEFALMDLFHVLQRKPKITKVELINRPLSANEFRALTLYLSSTSHLKHLTLHHAALSEDQIPVLLDSLQNHHDLENLGLSGDNSGSVPTLRNLARFINTRRKLSEISINDDEFTGPIIEEFIQATKECTSLRLLNSYNTDFTNHPIIEANWQRYNEQNSAYKQPAVEPVPETTLLPDTSHVPAILDLSADTLRVVLFQLGIRSLYRFRRTNKQFYSFTATASFWRDYYLRYFSCLPADLLLYTDWTYGLGLARSAVQSVQRSFWEELTVNLFKLKQIDGEKFPCNIAGNVDRFMNLVYRDYPQLIGLIEGSGSYASLPPHRVSLKYKRAPYSYTWFLLYARGDVIYHLGFERLHNGQMNGLHFLTPDFSSAFSDRFNYIRYVFDWCTANTEEEFAQRIKPVCDAFVVALENDNYGTSHCDSQISHNLPGLCKDVAITRSRLITEINDKLDAAAKEICTRLQISAKNSAQFVPVIDRMMTAVKSRTAVDSDLERLKQQLPTKSALSRRYETNFPGQVHNFHGHTWSMIDALPAPTVYRPPPRKHSQPPRTGAVAMMKLYRVLLNYTVMPILKLLWPMDSKNVDFRLPLVMKSKPSARTEDYNNIYFHSSYVPFEYVSISSAQPKWWPVTALSIARNILDSLVKAVDSIVESNWCKSDLTTDAVDALIERLMKIDLLPPRNINEIKTTLQAFKSC